MKIGKGLARRARSINNSIIKWLDVLNRGKIVVEVDTSKLDPSSRYKGG